MLILCRNCQNPLAVPRGGKGGDVPPLAFKEGEGGEEEEDVFGPEGPKNKKKMDINWYFCQFSKFKAFWKLFLNNFQIKWREGKQKIMESVWKPSVLVPSDNEGLSLTLTKSQLFDKEVLLDA